jgi:hypothetical protein
MAAAATLHTALVAALKTLPTVRAHDGKVPDDPAHDAAGRVYPYVVAWGNAGHTDPDARTLDGGADGALSWRPQLTVAAGDITWLLQAVDVIRALLDGLDLGGAVLREEPVDVAVTKDPVMRPDRWFVPLFFTTQAA